MVAETPRAKQRQYDRTTRPQAPRLCESSVNAVLLNVVSHFNTMLTFATGADIASTDWSGAAGKNARELGNLLHKSLDADINGMIIRMPV